MIFCVKKGRLRGLINSEQISDVLSNDYAQYLRFYG